MKYKLECRLKGGKRWLTLLEGGTAEKTADTIAFNLRKDEERELKVQWEYRIIAE